MSFKKSSGVIDLRGGRAPKRPPRGQVPLFSARPPEPPKRLMPLRAKRRRVRAAVALVVLFLCGAIFYAVSWASYLPQFNISTVTVAGARGVPEQLVRRTVDTVLDDGAYRILSRRNILLYPREEIEQKVVDSFPPVKSASITRDSLLATGLLITIEERAPFARWCTAAQEGSCYFMDDEGYLFAPIGTGEEATSSTRYVFTGGIASSTNAVGESFVRAHLPGVLSLLRLLGQGGFTPQGAHVDNDRDFFVTLGEGFLLKASYGADANTLVKNLQLVLSSDVLKDKRGQLEYVDLRFNNRAYYKLKGQEQQSAQ